MALKSFAKLLDYLVLTKRKVIYFENRLIELTHSNKFAKLSRLSVQIFVDDEYRLGCIRFPHHRDSCLVVAHCVISSIHRLHLP